MAVSSSQSKIGCLVIGASHAGVNLAFALRKEQYDHPILLVDGDKALPYHRPPLSKAFLTSDEPIEKNALKSAESYQTANINLMLGWRVESVDLSTKSATLINQTGAVTNQHVTFDKLVFATGARPFIPPIKGLDTASHLFPLRTADDVTEIKAALTQYQQPKVVVIGGGYIGLETAASLTKLGANVTVLERETRLLARVTSPYMSNFFEQLHVNNGVDIRCNQNVETIQRVGASNQITCSDGNTYPADIIIVGVGIRVNTELANDIGLTVENGIKVNEFGQTSHSDVYAIGDCSFHLNPHYDRYLRLESVQNAVDQAKCVAKHLTDKPQTYDTIPWFWSDQYDVKLQMVGLAQGYDDFVVREEAENKLSVWYFNQDQLLAVDAVNNAKAYVLGTKAIKNRLVIDKAQLKDPTMPIPK